MPLWNQFVAVHSTLASGIWPGARGASALQCPLGFTLAVPCTTSLGYRVARAELERIPYRDFQKRNSQYLVPAPSSLYFLWRLLTKFQQFTWRIADTIQDSLQQPFGQCPTAKFFITLLKTGDIAPWGPINCCRSWRHQVMVAKADEVTARLTADHPSTCARGSGSEQATDVTSRRPVSRKELSGIVERLYRTHTSSSIGGTNLPNPGQARDILSSPPVQQTELDAIVDRLFTSHTKASSGEACKVPAYQGPPSRSASDEEQVAISARLNSTHTKSSSGGVDCRTYPNPNPPGYGLKMFPVIEGLDTRFMGDKVAPEKVQEVIVKMHKTQTKASQARIDNPRHLLYPERTLLMNNVERIEQYQTTGGLVRQNLLQRREKWYNWLQIPD